MNKISNFQLNILGGNTRSLEDLMLGQRLLILVFYRGFHCSICNRYINRWGAYYPEFKQIGVEVIAVSTDTEAKAEQARREWFTGDLPIAHSFSLEEGKKLGLFVGHGTNPGEPEEYLQPGLFVLSPKLDELAVSIQSTAYARPDINALFVDLNQKLESHK